jgi:hypothetical protein
MASNALTTAGRFGSSRATEPAGRGQRFPQIVVSAFRGPVQNSQYERYRRPTKRDAFLATMEQIVDRFGGQPRGSARLRTSI